MLDRNKTALTHRVTATSAAYLAAFGCKPVETEVPIGFGRIADVASYWYPTRTEARKLHLPQRLAAELGITVSDLPPHFWVGDGPLTALVEVKTTLADFRKDKKWDGPPLGHICLLAFPHGMLAAEEIPRGWYGLETSASGEKLLKVHWREARFNAQHPALTLDFVAAVGIRRDHRTRWTAFRDWRRASAAEDCKSKRLYSATRLLAGLGSWLQGRNGRADETLSQVLADCGIREIPQSLGKTLASLQSIRTALSSRD